MKIATFNINNINRRLPNLLRWLRAAKPDIVCLQELKAADAEFPLLAIEKAGYGAVWRGQKTWNGVAILARNAEPVLTRTALPGDRDDARRAISKPPSTASSSPASICRTAIRSPGRNSITSSTGSNGCGRTPPNCSSRTSRSCWPATTTSRRRLRYLSDEILGQGRADPAEEPRRFQGAGRPGLDRRDPHPASVETDVHVLGLQAQPLAARRRTAARSSAAEPGACAATDQGRRRPQGSRRGRRQRSRAGVDRAEVAGSASRYPPNFLRSMMPRMLE